YQYGFLKEMAEMADLGFDVRLSNGKDGQRGVMHNKFVVLDGRLVETGSFNWTFNGELNNYENAAFLDAPDDSAGWTAYFERIWNQARVPTPDDHRDRAALGAGDGLSRPDFAPEPLVRPAPPVRRLDRKALMKLNRRSKKSRRFRHRRR
ncbi:MAG TPA: phospholipase D-like domain-containing protein, partial [Elusimicrobiota bacterium]|nr:phospholipase D-like domain-containing protein [Elusimicrobiota bacterium]